MKHIKSPIRLAALFVVLSLLLAWPAMAQDWPRPQGPVADYAKVISPKAANLIEGVSRELLQKTGASLVVATIPSLDNETIEQAAVRLFEQWGIGQKGKDEGILTLIAVKDHKLRIEVGYGLEGIITDAKAGMVRDQALVPYLKKGDYGQGLYAASSALAQFIAKDKGVTLTGVPEVQLQQTGSGIRVWGLLILFAVLFFASRFIRRGGGPRGGGGGGLLTGLLLGSMISSGYRGGGGGGFGGFGGGGFGGFGGGMSGGGGASGGW